MYTTDELADCSGVSKRKIEEWNRDGLLPNCGRPKVPGQTGRGSWVFPETAVDIVRWLAKHRRSIDGPDRLKGWLWLEGYDHVSIDIEQVQAATRIAWSAFQILVPGLPDKPTTPVNDQEETAVLDALDASLTQRLLKQSRGTPAARQLVAAVAGILGVKYYTEKSDTPFTLLRAVQSVVQHSGKLIPIDGLGSDDCIPLNEILTALSIPAAIERQCDIHHARLLWRACNALIELYAEHPHWSRATNVLSTLQQRLYARNPYFVIFALATFGASIAREEDIGPQCRRIIAEAEKRRRSATMPQAHSPAAS